MPNVNPDAAFAMQISIEESLTDTDQACFQSALLYTSSRGKSVLPMAGSVANLKQIQRLEGAMQLLYVVLKFE